MSSFSTKVSLLRTSVFCEDDRLIYPRFYTDEYVPWWGDPSVSAFVKSFIEQRDEILSLQKSFQTRSSGSSSYFPGFSIESFETDGVSVHSETGERRFKHSHNPSYTAQRRETEKASRGTVNLHRLLPNSQNPSFPHLGRSHRSLHLPVPCAMAGRIKIENGSVAQNVLSLDFSFVRDR